MTNYTLATWPTMPCSKCAQPATVTVNGKPYCSAHAPRPVSREVREKKAADYNAACVRFVEGLANDTAPYQTYSQCMLKAIALVNEHKPKD